MDETGMRVLGKNWWLWSFRTPHDDALVVIKPSRGGDVLKEIYQYIASMFATWRLQEKDVYNELQELLTNELCLR